MASVENVALALATLLFGFAKVAIPAGILCSLIKLAGQRFSLPAVEALGARGEAFFSNVPKLITGSSAKAGPVKDDGAK